MLSGTARSVGGVATARVNLYEAHTALAEHAHDRPTLSIIMRGWQIERLGSLEHRREPLSVIYKPGGVEHENRIGDRRTRALLIELEPDWIDDASRALGALLPQEPPAWPGLRAAAANLCRAVEWEPDELAEAVLLVLSELAGPRLRRPIPKWLSSCREELCDHYADPPTLAELAAEHAVHPVHVAQAFRRHLGCTTGELVRRRRVERALELMTTTGAPLAEIAITVGFADQSHMTRVFRRLVGAPPGRVRRLLCAP